MAMNMQGLMLFLLSLLWTFCYWFPGGGSPYTRYTRVCHFRGWVFEEFALHKGLLLKFCLTKGSIFSLKSALQQGPFLLKFEVSPLKNAYFADFNGKNFRKSSESHILRSFLPTFSWICLTKGSNFRRWRHLLKGGVSNPEMAHPRTKIGEEPPPPRGPAFPRLFSTSYE